MPESSDWILKIISGPHQGAEAALPPGRVVVGSHVESDIILHDVLVAPQHFALSLADGKMTVEPLEGPLFSNGKRVAGPSLVPPFAFLTAGTTHLVLGPATARWPLLSIADVPELEKTAPPAEPTTAAATAPDVAVGAKKSRPKPPTPEQRRRAWWTAGAGGALLVVWMILWFTWAPRSTVAPHPSSRERADQVLRAFPDAKGVQLLSQGDGLVAKGYVSSESAQRELAAAFREDAPEVSVRIWSTPRLLETARSVIANRNQQLEVSAVDDGRLRIRGVVRSAEEWTRTRQALLSEVPGLENLVDEVTVARASAPDRRNEPSADPRPAAPLAPPVALSVVALQELGDGQGWLRLSNGAVLFRGATLPAGARIVAFQDGQAVVEHATGRAALSVGSDITPALQGTPGPTPTVPAAALPRTAPVAAKEIDPRNG